MSYDADDSTDRADAPDGALSPGSTATGNPTSLGSDSNPFEKGTADPMGGGSVTDDPATGDPNGAAADQTYDIDGGRPDGNPEALIEGGRVTVASDMERHEPDEPVYGENDPSGQDEIDR